MAARYQSDSYVVATVSPGPTFKQAHLFWGRPEDLAAPSTVYTIGPGEGGGDLFAAAAAGLAAASMVFQGSDLMYSDQLLQAAADLYMQVGAGVVQRLGGSSLCSPWAARWMALPSWAAVSLPLFNSQLIAPPHSLCPPAHPAHPCTHPHRHTHTLHTGTHAHPLPRPPWTRASTPRAPPLSAATMTHTHTWTTSAGQLPGLHTGGGGGGVPLGECVRWQV